MLLLFAAVRGPIRDEKECEIRSLRHLLLVCDGLRHCFYEEWSRGDWLTPCVFAGPPEVKLELISSRVSYPNEARGMDDAVKWV